MSKRLSLISFLAVLFLWAGTLMLAQDQAQNAQITNGPTVEHVDANSATIAWSTNVSSSTLVRYGLDRNNLDQTAEAPWGGVTHRVTLQNLQPGKTYYYQVQSGQGQGTGTGALSAVGQFDTPQPGQQASPSQQSSPQQQSSAQQQPSGAEESNIQVIIGPVPQQVTDKSANMWWETNMPGSTILKYGTSQGKLDQTAQEPWGKQSHEVTLGNLQPDTTYYVQIQTPSGRVLRDGQFKSAPANYAQQFHFTDGPRVESLSDNSATLAWTTDKPASTVVKYGTDVNNLNQTAQAPWGQGTHRVTLSNLNPNTTYWIEVSSAQAQGSGQSAQSVKFPLQTQAPGQQALKIAEQPK